MNAKILETFKSIQGEGRYAGVSQVFVRFFECNMHCSWCDTPNSIGDTVRNFDERGLDEVFGQIDALWDDCHSVSLTGGEPLLQADFIKDLLPKMKEVKMLAYLETNGILPDELKKVIDNIDIVAMDLKLPSSTKCKSYWDEHCEFLNIAKQKETFIKTVITSDTDPEEVNQAMDLVASVDPSMLFILQPNYFEMRNGVISKCIDFQKHAKNRLNDVRIIPQTHKFMKLR